MLSDRFRRLHHVRDPGPDRPCIPDLQVERRDAVRTFPEFLEGQLELIRLGRLQMAVRQIRQSLLLLLR